MIFLNLILKEIKQQLKSVTFYIFIIIVSIFYITQYNDTVNRLKPPKQDYVYNVIEVKSEGDKLIIGYKILNGILLDKHIYKYYPISKNVKLSDSQLDEVKVILNKMSSNDDVLNIKISDINIDYDTMIYYMDSLDESLGGNTILGEKYRSFAREMTYDEACDDYQKIIDSNKITDSYGRLLVDYLGIVAAMFGVFVCVVSANRDKTYGVEDIVYSSNVNSIIYIVSKAIGLLISIMAVFLFIGLIETIIFLMESVKYNIQVDLLVIFKYIIIWLGPTVMFEICLCMFIVVVVENKIIPIIIQLGITFLCLSNTEYFGDYSFSKFIIRFNTIDSSDIYSKVSDAIIYNRIFYFCISVVICVLTIWISNMKRNKILGRHK